MNKPNDPKPPAQPKADLERDDSAAKANPRREEFFMDMPRKGATERRREGKR